MSLPNPLPTNLQPFAELPLEQWPLWARGVLARRTRRVSGAAAISAGARVHGVVVPRGQATTALAADYSLEAVRTLLLNPTAASLLDRVLADWPDDASDDDSSEDGVEDAPSVPYDELLSAAEVAVMCTEACSVASGIAPSPLPCGVSALAFAFQSS